MFLRNRFYYAVLAVVLVLVAGHFWEPLFVVGKVLLALLVLAVAADVVLLWRRRDITASRSCAGRFSNGDDNEVSLRIDSSYPFAVRIHVIDEVPHIFQRRDVGFDATLPPTGGAAIRYRLRPTQRGVYGFGHIRVFARTTLALVERRYTCGEPLDVAVYPSYMMLNQYELLAMSNNLTEMGIKRIRRAGNNTEFEQIKDYVQGDDYRTINWKASARRAQLMVNVYTDERSQQVFSLIDKGRVMQQAFEGMTLLDYAINAALVISYVAIRKEDRAGLLTFDAELDDFVPAERQGGHMQDILESLYGQETDFDESDYSALCNNVNRLIGKRSLLILYTNFSGLNSLNRQLPYLRQLNKRHRLLVVFFDDVELRRFVATPAHGIEDHYQHIIAEKVDYEKRLIVTTLRQQGILSLLTAPDKLSINLINKYLEIKARGMI
ncbi:MAG: DUF58 domain-containing protein [Muribaculaceae bacterium]|nr:DUF58 domain-containing protein [Muribaculaceae bacterium]